MNCYRSLAANEAYRLVGHGPLVLVSTRSQRGRYDIAPVAWNCAVNDDPTRLLVVVDKNHATAANIRKQKSFIVSVPHVSQARLVKEAGSVSGKKADKFHTFGIDAFGGQKVDALIPAGCVGYVECRLIKTLRVEFVDIFVGEYLAAGAETTAFGKRLFAEKAAGKTLHHLGGRRFAIPGDRIL
ncbi:MAG TPA: flavin reductase family protein [bacterium]|nr:flavin reductase family protein [bacterium]